MSTIVLHRYWAQYLEKIKQAVNYYDEADGYMKLYDEQITFSYYCSKKDHFTYIKRSMLFYEKAQMNYSKGDEIRKEAIRDYETVTSDYFGSFISINFDNGVIWLDTYKYRTPFPLREFYDSSP